MVDVYEYLGRAVRKSNEVDSDVGLISEALILPGGFSERINVHVNGLKQLYKTIDLSNSFIFSSRRGGILGTNKLGIHRDQGLYSIYNGENTYYERLTNTDFINTGSSTASIVTGSNITIDSGEEFWTNPVYFSLTSDCVAAKVYLGTDDYNLDDTTIYLRNSPTNDWQEYELSPEKKFMYFDNPGKQLEMKMVSTGSDNYLTLDASKVLYKLEYIDEQTLYIFTEPGESELFYDVGSSNNMIIDTDVTQPAMIFLTGASTYVSKAIPLRSEFTSVELEIGSITGSVTAYISNDGKDTWTVLPQNTLTNLYFNTQDKAYIKFINNIKSPVVSNRFDTTAPFFPVVFEEVTNAGSDNTTMWRDSEGAQYTLTFKK